MPGHVLPLRIYIGVFLALLALTALTTGVAFIDLGPLNTAAALAIAGVKMLLVVLFFMHARYSSSLVKIVILAGFFWLALLLSFTLTDVESRHWTPAPAPWSAPPQPAPKPVALQPPTRPATP
ncbi:MAG TPA: cytochrome C oxidase subunit IV family protein [Candidatus Acidoferrales bacterium]|nr:cytochrome C oxidase subunit IV family protein [Candidatus Acidoferrales bacterium]